MTWQGIHGHDEIVDDFRRRLRNQRLASTFLFVGPPGVGKRMFAIKLAQALLCETNPEVAFEPCGHCPACQQVAAGTHPDLIVVSRKANSSRITIDQLVGPEDKRMQEGLVHDIGLKPFYGGRKIGIIEDADSLAAGQGESANCLLKTLEEPPPRSVLILLGTSEQRQLPTIRSRAQVVRFEPLANTMVAELVLQQGIVPDAAQAEQLAELAQGNMQMAQEFADGEVREFRQRLLRFLSDAQPDSAAISKPLTTFVDDAGKEAPLRRARLRLLAGVAIEFYRQLLWALSGNEPTGDEPLRQAAQLAARQWNRETEVAASALERCLDLLLQVDANANQSTLIEAWLDDLAQLRLVGRTPL
ncbi:MAG TPA: DNA polymerase III subunit [Pirellulaceae bacterium]|nr:DNA polymerase III subunit [Pirellulaceae bacterium]